MRIFDDQIAFGERAVRSRRLRPSKGAAVSVMDPRRPDLDSVGADPIAQSDRRRRSGEVLLSAVVATVFIIVGLVAAGLVATRAGSSSDAPRAAPTSGRRPGTGRVPENLRGKATSRKVTLTWRPGVGGSEVAHWIVTRDGESVGSWKRRTRLVDHDVVPATTYVYEVAALDEFGVATAPRPIRLHTRPASPATAQVEGVFDVRLHVRSSYGDQWGRRLHGGVAGDALVRRGAVPRSCPGAADRAGPVRDRVQAGSLRGGGI